MTRRKAVDPEHENIMAGLKRMVAAIAANAGNAAAAKPDGPYRAAHDDPDAFYWFLSETGMCDDDYMSHVAFTDFMNQPASLDIWLAEQGDKY